MFVTHTRLAFNHHPASSSTEAEYDRLRGLARQEAGKRSSCLAKSHQAYERGDGGAAHELSEEGKRHGAMMDTYNRQASEYIFRENNAVVRIFFLLGYIWKGNSMLTLSLCGAVGESGWGYD